MVHARKVRDARTNRSQTDFQRSEITQEKTCLDFFYILFISLLYGTLKIMRHDECFWVAVLCFFTGLLICTWMMTHGL